MNDETTRTTMQGLYRFAVMLGVLALVSPVFGPLYDHGPKTNFVDVHHAGAVAFVVIGLAAVAGGLLRRLTLVLAAGLLAAAAAVLQLIQLPGSGANWLDGNASSMSLFLGVALGLVVTAAGLGRSGLAPTDDVEVSGV